jgi:hypothetical protein
MEGIEQQGLPLEHPGTGRRDRLLVSPVQGHLCVLFGLLVECGYIPMLMISTLRYGEGELAFSNIKISLEGKNGTGLGVSLSPIWVILRDVGFVVWCEGWQLGWQMV